MEGSKKRLLAIVIVLVLLRVVTIFALVWVWGDTSIYTPGRLPKGFAYAEVTSGSPMSAEERYEAYDREADPAHPVLDVQTTVAISNLGSRPGEARPLDLAREYPPLMTGTPPAAVSPPPVVADPDRDGTVVLPELFVVNREVPSPQFTGTSYPLDWEYTGSEKSTYTVSLSTDGGKAFKELARGLTTTGYAAALPTKPAEKVVLRVAAVLDGTVQQTADTSVFAIAEAPGPTPQPIRNFVDPRIAYVDTPGLRINRIPKSLVWFKADTRADDAQSVIWELSKTPFWGTRDGYGAEAGVIATGTVDMSMKGEFSLDLDTLCSQLSAPNATRPANAPYLVSRSAYQFYLRVVALDVNGMPIGDPGRGIDFTYGTPDIRPGELAAAMVQEPKIQTQVYVPYYWDYRWERISPAVLNRDVEDASDRVFFAGTDGPHAGYDSPVAGVEDAVPDSSESVVASVEDAVPGQDSDEKGLGSRIISQAVQVEVQVATSPYSDSITLGRTPPAGLVYSWVDTAPNIARSDQYGSTYYTPLSHGIEYGQFVPPKKTLEAMGGITYYVRAVFYVPDATNPSVLHPYPSETLTVAYRATDASENEIKQVEVRSDIPYVQFQRYVPVQWQHPDYDEYFEVTRHIEAEEMTFAFEKGDEFLLPYPAHVLKYGWTREQYQAKLDELLPPGAVIHYKKAEPGFWDEFFGLLNSIHSAVSEAYSDAKESVVSLVDYIPLIGDEARGYLKMAARMAIDYGLASIGIPPSLPNVDQLAAGGMDYVLKVAVDEALRSAGVPPDSAAAVQITKKVEQEVAKSVTDELEQALLAQQQNPLKADFLRLELDKLYAPAYVDVFVCNYSKTKTTRPGQIFVSPDTSFVVYESRAVAVPPLKPGDSVTIRVYLDHRRNEPGADGQGFDQWYNGNSSAPCTMIVYSHFPLPHVNDAAQEQGLKPAPLPFVTEFAYDHDAYSYRYEQEFVPAVPISEPDSTPKSSDFMD